VRTASKFYHVAGKSVGSEENFLCILRALAAAFLSLQQTAGQEKASYWEVGEDAPL
jgi:hypothetical protein